MQPPRPASSGYASRRKQPADTSIHFIFFDQLALVGLLDALTHGVTKTGIVLQQA
jgi:hypothetical protein